MLALRTFSKLYGMAGLRVGFGVGPSAVVAAMRKVQRGYDVGTLAQVAALASLDDTDEVERRRAANRAAIESLTALLRAHGLEPRPGTETNFVLVDVGVDANEAAAPLCGQESACNQECRSERRPRCESAPARVPISRFSTPRSLQPGSNSGFSTVKPNNPLRGRGRGLRYPGISGASAPLFV